MKSKFQLKWPKNPICFSALDGEGGQKPQDYTSNEQTKQIRKISDSRSSSSTRILWSSWHTDVCCRSQLEWPRWTLLFFFFSSLSHLQTGWPSSFRLNIYFRLFSETLEVCKCVFLISFWKRCKLSFLIW